MLTLPKLDRVRLEDLPCLTSVNTVEEILQLIGGKHPIIEYLYRGFQLSTILLVEQEFFHPLHYYNNQEKKNWTSPLVKNLYTHKCSVLFEPHRVTYWHESNAQPLQLFLWDKRRYLYLL